MNSAFDLAKFCFIEFSSSSWLTLKLKSWRLHIKGYMAQVKSLTIQNIWIRLDCFVKKKPEQLKRGLLTFIKLKINKNIIITQTCLLFHGFTVTTSTGLLTNEIWHKEENIFSHNFCFEFQICKTKADWLQLKLELQMYCQQKSVQLFIIIIAA